MAADTSPFFFEEAVDAVLAFVANLEYWARFGQESGGEELEVFAEYKVSPSGDASRRVSSCPPTHRVGVRFGLVAGCRRHVYVYIYVAPCQ